MKLLSVSIAAYNVEKYIETALMPFAKNEYRDLVEVFVIDDCGTDKTLDIAQKYAKKFPEIFIPVHKENGGWGSTVNYGIQNATGKYFKILDGDDFYDEKSLASFIDVLQACDADIVLSTYNEIEDETCRVVKKHLVDVANGEYRLDEVIDKIPLMMHALSFKTQVLKDKEVSIKEKCFYTDVEYVVKAIDASDTIQVTDINLYQYRVSRDGQSCSPSGCRKHYKEHLDTLIDLLTFIKNVDETPKGMAIKSRVYEMAKSQYNVFFFLKPTTSHKKELQNYDSYLKIADSNCYDKMPLYIKIIRFIRFYPYPLWCALRCSVPYMRKIKHMINR